jgi:hypothetical protein
MSFLGPTEMQFVGPQMLGRFYGRIAEEMKRRAFVAGGYATSARLLGHEPTRKAFVI